METPKYIITNLEFEGIDSSGYPDFTDAFIVSADCNGIEMTEKEIDKLEISDYYDELIQSMI